MKKFIYIPFLLLIGGMASAEYTITVPLTKSGGGALPDDSINITSDWQNSSTEYSQWSNTGEIYGCSNWTPLTSSITIGQTFTQMATDCSQNQVRTAQDKEIEKISGITKNKGASYIETQTITVSDTREAVGSLETWVETTPTYTSWSNIGSAYDCQNWSPSPNTITIGQSFTQTATDCKQNQERNRQNKEIETTTNQLRDVGTLVTESKVIVVSSNRNSIGTKETWVAATPTYSDWVNSGVISECTNWSPETSTVTIGKSFIQTATDCNQNQTRTRQNREIETTTNQLRDVGQPITETQKVTVSSSRNSIGTMETWIATTPTYTAWVNSGAISGCTNWSPETSTVTIGQLFTQTATDCDQTQVRSKQNREIETTTNQIRDVGTPVSESQVVTVSSTRNVTGTKETWVAITPTYTSWVNNGNVTGCSNWSPATSTKPKGESFTQTATDCSQPQTRSRQEREQETTTKAIRNKGSAVVENQTVPASSTRSAIGTKIIEECDYYSDYTYSKNTYVSSDDWSENLFFWNGTLLGKTSLNINKFNHGKYTYSKGVKKGEFATDMYIYSLYLICRTPI